MANGNTAADLLVRIDATTEALRRELNRGLGDVDKFASKTESSLGRIDGAFSKLSSGFRSVNSLLGALGIGASVAGLVQLGRASLSLADDIDDTSKRLGIAAETLQLYRSASLETGVEQGALEIAIKKVQVALGAAANGSDAAAKKFKALNIDFRDSSGNAVGFEEVMLRLADRISSLQDPAQKAAAAAKLLGDRAGPELVPLLDQGRAGLERFFQAARDGGQVMSDETVERLGKAADEIEKFKNRIVIATGEILAAISKFSDDTPEEMAAQFELVNREIQDLTANLKEAREGGINFTVGALGGREAAEKRLLEITQRRADLLLRMGRGGLGDSAAPPAVAAVAAGDVDLGTGDTAGENAAKKVEAAIEAVRVKIRTVSAEIADDPLGKALAENFDRAGLSLDDFSAKAEELRALTELQVDAEQRLAIGKEVLTAVTEADTAAVAEYNNKLKEGQAITDETRTALETYNAELERASLLLQEGFINQDTFNRFVQKAGEDFVAADEASQRLIQSASEIGRGFVTAFGQIGTSINSTKELLASLLNTIANVLGNLAGTGIEALLTNAFSPSAPTGPALVGSGPVVSPSLTRRARGGRAVPGRGYLVGEEGPEPFFPDVPGTISPAGAGGGINIQQNIQVNASGGTAQQNDDLSKKMGVEFERAMTVKFRELLGDEMRDRGLLKPNIA